MSDLVIRGEKVTVHFAQYGNGRTAIILNCLSGERYAVATCNLPDIELASDEVAVKDWSENEGMLTWLILQGIVSQPVRFERTGRVLSPICKLLVEVKNAS